MQPQKALHEKGRHRETVNCILSCCFFMRRVSLRQLDFSGKCYWLHREIPPNPFPFRGFHQRGVFFSRSSRRFSRYRVAASESAIKATATSGLPLLLFAYFDRQTASLLGQCLPALELLFSLVLMFAFAQSR